MISDTKYKSHKNSLSSIFIRGLFSIFCVCMASSSCAGSNPLNATDAEIALLPSYCVDTEAFNYGTKGAPNQSPKAAYWEGIMGPAFWALHHSCWSKVAVMRSFRSGITAYERKALLEYAISNYMYVVKNSKPDFILLPEIYTNIGDLELKLYQFNKANSAFSLARTAKPDYWPAYSHWAEYLIKTGKKKDAMGLLKTGLEYSPQSKVLIELYRSIGGKLSDIAPNKVERESD